MLYPEGAVLLAPLAGYTDAPFRRACRRFGCVYAFTPLVDAQSVIHCNWRNRVSLHRDSDEPWLGVQILAARPEPLAEALRILGDYPFDCIDLNMGCPVPKVTRRGAGAGILGDPERAVACARAAVAVSRVPVTAKIRVISDQHAHDTVRLVQALEAAGVQAVTVHGRIRARMYAGPVAMHVIRAVREAVDVPVIANGGVFCAADAQRLREGTGCSRVMVARGAIGNPWLFADLAGRPDPPPHEEVCAVLEDHVLGMIDLYGEEVALKVARKIVAAYLKGRGYRRVRREQACRLATGSEFHDFLAILRDEGPSHRFAASEPGAPAAG